MLCLKVPTDGAWAIVAMRDLDGILVDHAHCELKAASNSLSLAARYPAGVEIAQALTDLAREEIDHFQRVLSELAARGRQLGAPPIDDYAAALRRAASELPRAQHSVVDSASDDLFAVDGDVARAFTALAGWRPRLASDPEGCADEDPLLGLRHVAAKSTADALAQQSASMADEALRDALCQWVRALGLARIELVDELAQALAAAETRGRFEGRSPKRASCP